MLVNTNKAQRSKQSILVDAKEFLKILVPVIQRMPKIERHEGFGKIMLACLLDIIGHFSIAYNCLEARTLCIRLLIADVAKLEANFELAIYSGIIPKGKRADMAERLGAISEATIKWRNSQKSSVGSKS